MKLLQPKSTSVKNPPPILQPIKVEKEAPSWFDWLMCGAQCGSGQQNTQNHQGTPTMLDLKSTGKPPLMRIDDSGSLLPYGDGGPVSALQSSSHPASDWLKSADPEEKDDSFVNLFYNSGGPVS